MNVNCILKSRQLWLLMSRNLTKSPRFIPMESEPGTFPHIKKQASLDGLKSYEERINEIAAAKFDRPLEPVNIGCPLARSSRFAKSSRKEGKIATSKTLKKPIDIDIDTIDYETKTAAASNNFVKAKHNIAEFFNIYSDLFRSPHHFYPIKHLELQYDGGAHGDGVGVPVCQGNLVSPSTARLTPTIHWDNADDDSSRWTLTMSCPDEHLERSDCEYAHWILSNIVMKDNNVVDMDCVVPYLQPIPYLGTGFHRYVFVLYKQDTGKIDLSSYSLSENCRLEDRTFSSYEFLRENQNCLTPVGLAFFQSSWDSSVRECFRNTLNCFEPIFEYNWPKEKLRPMQEFPALKEMHTYYDQYRDIKDLREEVLKERLKTVDPYKKSKRLEFPLGIPDDPNEMGFVKEKFRDKELRRNHWKEMDVTNE